MSLNIQHEEAHGHGAFFIQTSDKRVAEMAYTRNNPALITIIHTKVDDAMAGQGVARQLLDTLLAWVRSNDTKVIAVCPYAKSQFVKDPSIRDVLA